MSMNIDGVEVISSSAWMYAKDILGCVDLDLTEGNFIADFTERFPKVPAAPDNRIYLTHRLPYPKKPKDTEVVFDWSGEGSGYSWDVFKKSVAPLIHGRIEGVLFWEGGEGASGFVVEDGKYKDMDVEYTLVDKER